MLFLSHTSIRNVHKQFEIFYVQNGNFENLKIHCRFKLARIVYQYDGTGLPKNFLAENVILCITSLACLSASKKKGIRKFNKIEEICPNMHCDITFIYGSVELVACPMNMTLHNYIELNMFNSGASTQKALAGKPNT